MGHPLVVAARYRKGPQMLLGPELFPYWLFAIKAGALILSGVFAINLGIRVFSGPADAGQAISQTIGGLFSSGLTMIGAITLAGAACEHFGVRPRYLDTWRVKDLPILRFGDPAHWAALFSPASATATAGEAPVPPRTPSAGGRPFDGSPPFRPRRPRAPRGPGWPGSQALGSLVGWILFVLWWIGALHIPGTITLGRHDKAMDVVPTAIWATLYVPILVYALARIAVDAIGVVQPGAVRVRAAMQIPLALAGIALTWMVFQAHEWFMLVNGTDRAVVSGGTSLLDVHAFERLDHAGRSVAGIAEGLSIGMTWGLALVALSLGLRDPGQPLAAVQTESGVTDRAVTPGSGLQQVAEAEREDRAAVRMVARADADRHGIGKAFHYRQAQPAAAVAVATATLGEDLEYPRPGIGARPGPSSRIASVTASVERRPSIVIGVPGSA